MFPIYSCKLFSPKTPKPENEHIIKVFKKQSYTWVDSKLWWCSETFRTSNENREMCEHF